MATGPLSHAGALSFAAAGLLVSRSLGAKAGDWGSLDPWFGAFFLEGV